MGRSIEIHLFLRRVEVWSVEGDERTLVEVASDTSSLRTLDRSTPRSGADLRWSRYFDGVVVDRRGCDI